MRLLLARIAGELRQHLYLRILRHREVLPRLRPRPSLVVALVALVSLLVGFHYSGSSSPGDKRPQIWINPGDETVNPFLQHICQIHYRIHHENPLSEPETFFEILELDAFSRPFLGLGWLSNGQSLYTEAKDMILKEWAKKKNRMMVNEPFSDAERHLDHAVAVLINIAQARVYMAAVMPVLSSKKGDRRLKALKQLCGEAWTAIPYARTVDEEFDAS